MPSVWNEIEVTNGNDTGTGSLRWAIEKATDTEDPDYENWARLIIDDAVNTITLQSEVIDGAIALTKLDIITENDEDVTILGDDQQFPFMAHTGNNGIDIFFSHLTFEDFGTTADGGAISTVAPLTLESCGFDGNLAEGNGGAIYSEYSLDMTDCYFYGNQAYHGGAIYCAPEHSAAGITITESEFTSNEAGGDGGAIYFLAINGTLGIYGDYTAFTSNTALQGKGGAVYQYGGGIEAIIGSAGPPYAEGFIFDNDSGHGEALYLTELGHAHIDADVRGATVGTEDPPNGPLIYLHSDVPPVEHNYWSYINYSRVDGGMSGIDSNWPYYPTE